MKIEIDDTKKWQHSFTLKIVLLAIMGLFLLIPLEMIKSVIKERQNNSEKVRKEIAFQWAAAQNISGPVLNIPVRITPVRKETEPYTVVYHFMPENLDIKGDIKPEKRHRSIYQAVVYSSSLALSGEFLKPEISQLQNGEILWKDAYITLGVSDNRGLKGSIILRSDSIVQEAVPGLADTDVFSTGITFPFSLNKESKNIPFMMNINISGSEEISFSPVGKTTKVILSSSWNSPGFRGNFLPVTRTISDSGFSAEWLVTNLNRNFPQVWPGNEFKPMNDSFGVEFVLLVDHYQKSLRSAKYGILFIALTFLALLFAELMSGNNLHILNYLLVSLALVLFFSLLNALSEHLGFSPAYVVSSVATIVLLTLFLRKLIRNSRPVLLISGMLVFLYAFTFVLLTLNDYAYLAGNIGLFVLLATAMGLSSKYNVFSQSGKTGSETDIPV